MAKSEGIISNRAVALRKMKRKTTKMSRAVMAKLCAPVGDQVGYHLTCSTTTTTRICAP